MVCAIDNKQAGTASALATKEVAATAIAQSARQGYLEGEALASVFAWLRPNDLIWNYVVNNYMLGKEPPAFDILYWNQDTVRLAAGLHRDFVLLAMENALTKAGRVHRPRFSGRPQQGDARHLYRRRLDDHIVPWPSAYASTQLFGGETRFVLSASGHIQALINPPSPDSRSSFQVADENPPDPAEWSERAVTKRGSWWPDHVEWLSTRSGKLKPAPNELGNDGYRAQAKAPGTYVHAR